NRSLSLVMDTPLIGFYDLLAEILIRTIKEAKN
ncbi:unnamed protein product, partial [marine sediment metagenome]